MLKFTTGKTTWQNFIKFHSVLYNLPYRPQFNAMEYFFSKLKNEMERRGLTRDGYNGNNGMNSERITRN